MSVITLLSGLFFFYSHGDLTAADYQPPKTQYVKGYWRRKPARKGRNYYGY